MTDLEMDLILAKAEIATLKAEKDELEKAVAGNMFTVPDDWVKVVRCKDCKHRCEPTANGNFLCGRKMLGLVRPDDYCSFGERKDGANHG